MKILSIILVLLLLTGCSANPVTTAPTETTAATEPSGVPEVVQTPPVEAPDYHSRFDSVTEILLSDGGIQVNGGGETDTVFTSRDIVYYEDRETYESGNPYGEGEAHERHSADEAATHLVVNITAPGAYRVSGTLTAGQLRIDLGEDASSDPNAVVELILQDADITCTVAPAILFRNVYECDEEASVETATAEVDTSAAGANLILEGKNTVTGSHVAKILKDNSEEKKLVKEDGAVYSYQSMNVFGPGSLVLTADNEGLDTELHLTINGGSITIRSDNDGINTNEDGISVTTINGGEVCILAGLGAEGDGIDSNGYLVINGGSVIASANPAADAGLDSDLGSYIHGGTVVALGSTMDWAESDSRQVTMNLQFAAYRTAGSTITVTREGEVVFSFDPARLGDGSRQYKGAILSCPDFRQGERYQVGVDGVVQSYSGTDIGRDGPGGFGGFRGGRPEDFGGEMGQGFPDRGDGQRPQRPEGEMPTMPDGEVPPMPDGEIPTMPQGQQPPEGGFRDRGDVPGGESSTVFFMADKVNCFSGVADIEE